MFALYIYRCSLFAIIIVSNFYEHLNNSLQLMDWTLLKRSDIILYDQLSTVYYYFQIKNADSIKKGTCDKIITLINYFEIIYSARY